MDLSDPSGDENSSGEESSAPAKRCRANTYGASSTTSQGSGCQESGENSPIIQNTEVRNMRLSRSSMSENCSSPNDQYEDFRPGFADNDNDGEESISMRASFEQNNKGPTDNNSFYKTKSEDNDDIMMEYSEKSKMMMMNMGYKPGKGLGRFEHGRVEPVEASTQKGRRGLGMRPSAVGEVPQDFKWSPDDQDQPEVHEQPAWIPSSHEEPLSGDILEEWLQRGKKKLTIDDETLFVDPHILKGVIEAKTIFDTLYDEDLRNARFRSNPYETIGAVIFLNRAAVKMANIDAIFDFMFTDPKTPDGKPVLTKKDILYFADVCAGPGGFSEYVLYKKGWHAKGFGFTLKGPCDFKVHNFYAGPPETFDTYYGIKDDGNVYDPENLTSLKEYVLRQTNDQGIHFLMADGGFSVEGQENLQEILSKQLYLCQCLAALMLVRTGGHFVVKLFDVFTMFSVGLIYIMYRCFEQVCIHKPVTSRPANSERYLICKWKRQGTEATEQHLFNVNSMLFDGLDKDDDIAELVPLHVIQEDAKFFEYIFNSNCILGERQIKNLLKIAAFSKDKSLKETSQASIKEQCLRLWQLPNEVRKQPEKLGAEESLQKMLALMRMPPTITTQTFKANTLNRSPKYIDKPPDLEVFRHVYDWHFVFLSSGKHSQDLKIFMGCGGKHVYQLENSVWKNVSDLQITLPALTLIYAEVIKEYKGEGNNQVYSKALHIIDAMMLGGVDISDLPLSERINECDLFCTALSKPHESHQTMPMRCKRLFNLENMSSAMNYLEVRAMKRIKKAVTIDAPNRNDHNRTYYIVGSVMFIKEIKEPWIAQISKKTKYKYYYNTLNQRSEYHMDGASLDMPSAYMQRVQWPWEDAACAILESQVNNTISRAMFEEFINARTA